MMPRRLLTRTAGAVLGLALLSPSIANAGALPPDYVLSCENGRTYPIQARAVTVDGDLVTGYLYTGHRRGAHIRLVPMGAGYRYITRGVWVDGWRGDAEINFGTHKTLACTVTHG
jgi:hypothetical protein